MSTRMETLCMEFEVPDMHGIHMRPARWVAQWVNENLPGNAITIMKCKGQQADMRSELELIGLGAKQRDRVAVEISSSENLSGRQKEIRWGIEASLKKLGVEGA